MDWDTFKGWIRSLLQTEPHPTQVTFEEVDGSPSVDNVRTVKVTNASLTDNGNHGVTLDLAVGNHAAVTLGAGSDAALALAGQELTLADVLTPAEHTAIGNGAPHHAQLHDHSAAGDGQTLQPLNYKWPVATELTIASGAVTVTQSNHYIDTEGDAATDDLTTINGLVADQWYVFRAANSARTVVFKHAPTGVIRSVTGADLTLDEGYKFILGYAGPAGGYLLVSMPSVGGGGDVATDAIWDAAGDLAVGSGANTAAALTKGADGKVLSMVAGAVAWADPTGGGAMATDPLWDAAGDLAVGTGANTGAKLAITVPGAANLLNVLGVATGETTPTYKVLFDGTNPEAIGTAAPGTGVVAAHRNHVHAHGTPTSHDRRITCAIYLTPVSDTIPKWISPPLPLSTIISAEIKSYDACGATSQVIDICKQTAANKDTNTVATIWSTHANCLTLANTHYQAETTTFDVTAIAEGDRLYVYSHVLGTGLTVAYITITIRPT